MEKVAIYCRLSDEDRDKREGDESESIQNQKSMLIDYCKERNWEVFGVFCDEDYSGADSSRPEFNEMLAACANGLVDIVLCKTQSRFSRDMEIVEKYIHGKFLEWNIRFVGVVDHADTQIEGNKKSRQINGLINEWYLEDLSDNIKRTLRHKKQNGEFTGSFAPYGYLVDPNNKNHLIIDPIASEVVKEIFNMYINGYGYIKIAKELNTRQIPNPSTYKKQQGSSYYNRLQKTSARSKLWTDSTIYSILRKEVYTGTLVQGISENISYKNKKRKKLPESKWIKYPNAHEPIISSDTWVKALALRQKKGRCDKFTGEMYSLSKKVFCAECGSTMWKMSYQLANGRYKYLKCRMVKISSNRCCNTSSIRLDTLEKTILDEINKLLDEFYNPQMIEINTDSEQKGKEGALIKEQSALASLIEKKQGNMMVLYEDKLSGVISEAQFKILNQRILKECEALNVRTKIIENELAVLEQSNQKQRSKEDLLKKYRRIEALDKIVVDEFIESVHIGRINEDGAREIEIKWNI